MIRSILISISSFSYNFKSNLISAGLLHKTIITQAYFIFQLQPRLTTLSTQTIAPLNTIYKLINLGFCHQTINLLFIWICGLALFHSIYNLYADFIIMAEYLYKPQQIYIMHQKLIGRVSSILPQLQSRGYKGDNGRIGVIGGSYQFTGAPFYSAISALKSGADLGHIFCSKSSSISIKAYSPQIIVHPVFFSQQQQKYSKSQLPKIFDEWISKIKQWQKAVHSWVIGPGLGRDPYMHQFIPLLMKNIGKNKIVIFDADAIYYLAQHPQIFNYLRHCKTIITPNKKQINFLKPFLNFDVTKPIQYQKSKQEIQQLPKKYQNLHEFTLLLKGQQDVILGPKSYVVSTPGGHKRCGGIGDILAGVTGACSFWNFELGPVLAARIVKKATYHAYEKEGRSLTAPCIIKELSRSIREIQRDGR